ncbi:MAG: glycerol acyltransferase [Acidobacteria bacterium]|nr:MAG: glycerol acyltransferase [Acidobacteriota bacterium]
MSQFTLLKEKRFGPFFWTQFLGAFNDNLFKNALLIMFAFHGVTQLAGEESTLDASTLVNLSAGLFILPFFLFSALAGQLADKFEKGALIRIIKLFEIALMSIAAIGFIFNMPYLLLSLLFLMGTQSAFFGPVKYSILPQHLKEEELVGGNGMIEMGTFLAILLGTVVGGILIALQQGRVFVACGVVLLALIGWWTSKGIPLAKAADPTLKVAFNPLVETWKVIQFTRENHVVLRSILGISWFWFYGAIFLAQMPTFTEEVICGNELVVTLLLTVFSVGIGAGSLLCERFSHKRVELGLVPFGAIGLTLFALDLWWVSSGFEVRSTMGVAVFLREWQHWRLIVDLLMIGLFGGFYIVPLYALIQQRSQVENRSRVIAGNNILNALFMVAAALLAIVFLGRGYTIPQLFFLVAVLNAVVALYIFSLVPEFLLRFLIWIVVHLMYRLETEGEEHVPDEGGILVADCVSIVDYALLSGACFRPIRFVMDAKNFRRSLLSYFLKAGKAIPFSSKKEDPVVYEHASSEVKAALEEGELMGTSSKYWQPETNSSNSPRDEMAEIFNQRPLTPIIPVSIHSKEGGRSDSFTMKSPRRFWTKVVVVFHPARPPADLYLEVFQGGKK